ASEPDRSDSAESSSTSNNPPEKVVLGTKVKRPPVPARVLAFQEAAIAVAFTAPLAFTLLVLFGAPINSHLIPTAFLAILLSILTVWTPAYTFGVPSLTSQTLKAEERRQKWIGLFVEFSARSPVDRAILFPAVGAILGCWLGVSPMPLDWDRPWQAWPLTSAYMAVIGHLVGSGVSLALGRRQRLKSKAPPLEYHNINRRPHFNRLARTVSESLALENSGPQDRVMRAGQAAALQERIIRVRPTELDQAVVWEIEVVDGEDDVWFSLQARRVAQ
ncbi:unnamed protein product, partial [Rhizoctonia solani]